MALICTNVAVLRCSGNVEAEEPRKFRLAKSDLPPLFLIPPLCGTRLRAWSHVPCSGAQGIAPGDDIWVNAPLISTQPRCWQECARLWGPEMEDSPHCVSRPDEGLDSIYTLAQGLLGIFSHSMYEVIQGLTTELGYDPSRLHAMPYDFRLTPDKLESRDGYYSRMKSLMEAERRRLNMRAIVLAHSMGCRIFAYFLKWLEAELGRNHYLRWIDEHIAVYFANGNPIHGSPDVATSLLVGETQGMPISLKLVHEVLASAGGLAFLIPTEPRPNPPLPCCNAQNVCIPTNQSALPAAIYQHPWLRIVGTPELVTDAHNNSLDLGAETTCLASTSAASFFETVATTLNDTHTRDLASFLHRLCDDPAIGANAMELGIERPPIDTVHVTYGVGLETRLQTSFSATGGPTSQTLPYFVDRLPPAEREMYDLPTRTFVVSGAISEVGLFERKLVGDIDHVEPVGRSGDDTVPYASLSAAHDWLTYGGGNDTEVHVASVPLRRIFTRDEIWLGSYDAPNRRALYKEQQHDEPRMDIFEASFFRDGRALRTTLTELHGVAHRGSAQHSAFVQNVVRLVRAHALSVIEAKKQIGLYNEDLLKHDVLDNGPVLSQFLFQSRDYEPSSDADCYWSFTKSSCAYPTHCEYRYHVGDLSLSQSCRVKKHIIGDAAVQTVSE